MNQTYTATLTRGTLDLTYQTDEFALDELLGFAERINPKRAFLFVSKVLGRHIPVAPDVMKHAFVALANKIPDDLPTPIVVVGMAETAVGLSAGVHQALARRYPNALLMNSTRHAQNAPPFATFSEDHSHASCHLLYLSHDSVINDTLMHAKTLIMVDDEASTANTCANLVKALIQKGLHQLQQVHLATLADWSLGRATNPFGDEIAFFRHHLLSGSWVWTDAPNPAPIHMPDVSTVAQGSQPVADLPSFGRVPTYDSTGGFLPLLDTLTACFDVCDFVGKKVLVLGSNEFVWLPFLLAEHLQNQGVLVKFSSLTRSPIAVGGAIGSTLRFHDNYGLGMTNFVYNVVFDDWDKVILCIETPKDSVDKLWHDDKVVVVSPLG